MKLPFIIVTAVLTITACNTENKKGKIPSEEELAKIEPANSWFHEGENPKEYVMGYESGKGPDGSNAGTIVSVKEEIDGNGVLARGDKLENAQGKKLRMSGFIKSNKVNDWTGFFLRIGKSNTPRALSFASMEDAPVKGTTDWKKYELTVDVPADAEDMGYGIILQGTGQVWIDNISFDIIDESASNSQPIITPLPTENLNLDFENKFQPY